MKKPTLNFDFEHSKIFANLPLIVMGIPMIIAIFAPLAGPIKSAIMMIGPILAIPSIAMLTWYAKVSASEYIILKARIQPWGLEKEFVCERPAGSLSSTPKPETGTYLTQFKLAYEHYIPTIGDIDYIEIEHTQPWEERNLPRKGWAHWRGIEANVSNIILVEFWLPEKIVRTESLGLIMCFWLRSGSEDCIRFTERYKNDYNRGLVELLEKEMERH